MNSSLAASYILMATSSSTSVISFTHATQKITTTWNCGERTQGLGSSKPGKGILYQQLFHKVLSTGTDCRPWLLSKVRLFLQYLVVITKNQTQNKWALSIPQLNTSVWRGNTVWITCFFNSFSYLVKDASFSLLPKWAPSAQQDVRDDTNTPCIRLWTWFSLQHLWSNVVCTTHHIMESFACRKQKGYQLIDQWDQSQHPTFSTERDLWTWQVQNIPSSARCIQRKGKKSTPSRWCCCTWFDKVRQPKIRCLERWILFCRFEKKVLKNNGRLSSFCELVINEPDIVCIW